MNSQITNLKTNTLKTIHIMASGTTSYISVVNNLLKMHKGQKRAVDVYVYFRLGNNDERIAFFKKQYDIWWNDLKKVYPKLKFHFACINDFKMSFRGIIINKEKGFIGFYTRVNNKTSGTMDDSIYIDKNTDVGRYILSCFLNCFVGQQYYSTLKNCVDDSFGKNI